MTRDQMLLEVSCRQPGFVTGTVAVLTWCSLRWMSALLSIAQSELFSVNRLLSPLAGVLCPHRSECSDFLGAIGNGPSFFGAILSFPSVSSFIIRAFWSFILCSFEVWLLQISPFASWYNFWAVCDKVILSIVTIFCNSSTTTVTEWAMACATWYASDVLQFTLTDWSSNVGFLPKRRSGCSRLSM